MSRRLTCERSDDGCCSEVDAGTISLIEWDRKPRGAAGALQVPVLTLARMLWISSCQNTGNTILYGAAATDLAGILIFILLICYALQIV